MHEWRLWSRSRDRYEFDSRRFIAFNVINCYDTIASMIKYEIIINSLWKPWPEVIKPFSWSTQLSMKVFLPINVKMPTIVGILTFMSGKIFILD